MILAESFLISSQSEFNQLVCEIKIKFRNLLIWNFCENFWTIFWSFLKRFLKRSEGYRCYLKLSKNPLKPPLKFLKRLWKFTETLAMLRKRFRNFRLKFMKTFVQFYETVKFCLKLYRHFQLLRSTFKTF